MNALIIFVASLVITLLVVVFLPLPIGLMQIIAGMLGGNILMGLAFLIMANYYEKE